MVRNKKPSVTSRIKNNAKPAALISFWKTKVRPHITRKRVGIAAALLLVLMIGLPVVTYAYYARDIADRERLMNRNNTGVILKDRNGKAFYSSGVLSTRDDLKLSQISDNLEEAVVSSEDKDFYSHMGFSVRGTARALINNIRSQDASDAGGSTITQQLVKNKLVGSDKNYFRKYQELAMAVAVEREYTKEQILEMYLNSAYFGEGAFGIADASRTYFNKPASELTLAESSMLAGTLPAPSYYSPVSGDPEEAKASQANVLRKMVATGAITETDREEALNTELSYYNGASMGGSEAAQHFADMVIDDLVEKYGEERVRRSGYEVTTTLDLTKQKIAEETIKERVAETSEFGGRNAGLVSINPKNGEVLALIGSVNYMNEEFGQVNMATALRQPGSSFKPIYYSEAIDRRLITAGTIIEDKPTTYGGTYSPRNYDNRYRGDMSVRSALAESRNIPAVEVMQQLGVRNAVETAQRMGLNSVDQPDKYGLSLALGTAEVRLYNMVNVYAAFANQGKQFEPILYTAIKDKYGKTIATPDRDEPKQVLSADASYVISSILSDTSARAPTYGSSLNIPGKNVAFKTGTTNDSRDAWIIGYTPSIVTGVWLGNNENEPMTGLFGGSGAGSIWEPIMTEYLEDMPRENFAKPASVVAIRICTGTNLRAAASYGSTRTEYYLKGTEPSGRCNTQPEQPKVEEKKPEEEPKPEQPNQPEDNENQGEGNGNNNGSGNGNEDTGDDGTGSDGGDGTGGTGDDGSGGEDQPGGRGGDGEVSQPTDPQPPTRPERPTETE